MSNAYGRVKLAALGSNQRLQNVKLFLQGLTSISDRPNNAVRWPADWFTPVPNSNAVCLHRPKGHYISTKQDWNIAEGHRASIV